MLTDGLTVQRLCLCKPCLDERCATLLRGRENSSTATKQLLHSRLFTLRVLQQSLGTPINYVIKLSRIIWRVFPFLSFTHKHERNRSDRKLSTREKKLLSFGKKVERQNGKRKTGTWAHLRKSAKRYGSAVNKLTIKPQDKKKK